MKTKTLELIHKHMESGKIYFPEGKGPLCNFHLTDGQIRDIIASEYGFRPKRQRIIKKILKKIVNDLLSEILNDAV